MERNEEGGLVDKAMTPKGIRREGDNVVLSLTYKGTTYEAGAYFKNIEEAELMLKRLSKMATFTIKQVNDASPR